MKKENYTRPTVEPIDFRTTFEQVGEFHEIFGHPANTTPTQLPAETVRLRLSLILEEFSELYEACVGASITKMLHMEQMNAMMDKMRDQSLPINDKIDIVDAADALGDIKYVVDGAAHCWGIPLDKVSAEIHNSNMSKLGPDGKPMYRDDGKVQKGPMYHKPHIDLVLCRHVELLATVKHGLENNSNDKSQSD